MSDGWACDETRSAITQRDVKREEDEEERKRKQERQELQEFFAFHFISFHFCFFSLLGEVD